MCQKLHNLQSRFETLATWIITFEGRFMNISRSTKISNKILKLPTMSHFWAKKLNNSVDSEVAATHTTVNVALLTNSMHKAQPSSPSPTAQGKICLSYGWLRWNGSCHWKPFMSNFNLNLNAFDETRKY